MLTLYNNTKQVQIFSDKQHTDNTLTNDHGNEIWTMACSWWRSVGVTWKHKAVVCVKCSWCNEYLRWKLDDAEENGGGTLCVYNIIFICPWLKSTSRTDNLHVSLI